MQACLNEAIDLDIASAWKDAGFSHWSENMAKHHRKSCSALQRAVRLERVDVLPELLKHWDVNCAAGLSSSILLCVLCLCERFLCSEELLPGRLQGDALGRRRV